MAAAKSPPRKPNLRDLQKVQTRQRLVDAAREVFFREGYHTTTVDQIVAAAGASRPTFYLHFRDKEQLLAELMAIYSARAIPYMERIPGPRSTMEELRRWVGEVGELLEQQRALFSLVHEVSAHQQPNGPHYGLATVDIWITAMGRRSPAFAAAARKRNQDLEARARAEILVINLVWAASNLVRQKTSPFTKATVGVVVQGFHDFINDPRYHADASVPAAPAGLAGGRRRRARTSTEGVESRGEDA